MKLIIGLLILSYSSLSMAVCEKAKLNDSDTIYEGYLCKKTTLIGADKIEDFCIIRAETLEEEGETYKYTNMETRASSEDGWSNYYSTFKWHHKKNNSVAKMWENETKIKMKDITATDFMTANIYKVSEFQKKDLTLEIEVYKKKALIGIKKRKWYSATFNCTKFL